MNKENLNPPIKTASEARTLGKRGGQKSGEARKQRKQLAQVFEEILHARSLTKEEQKAADAVLLRMNKAQLKEIIEKEELPVYLLRRARLLLQKDDKQATDMAETMMDRAFGKPKQETETTINAELPIYVMPDGLDEENG